MKVSQSSSSTSTSTSCFILQELTSKGQSGQLGSGVVPGGVVTQEASRKRTDGLPIAMVMVMVDPIPNTVGRSGGAKFGFGELQRLYIAQNTCKGKGLMPYRYISLPPPPYDGFKWTLSATRLKRCSQTSHGKSNLCEPFDC